MNPTIVKPVADPLADIDRVAPVDNLMARQDRADLPGNRSDQPTGEDTPAENDNYNDSDSDSDEGDASIDPDDIATSEDPDIALTLDNTVGARPGLGPDDDEPIEETERLGDDSRTV